VPGILVPFVLLTLIYIGLAAVVIALVRRTIAETSPSQMHP
jgi:hypothetical protein